MIEELYKFIKDPIIVNDKKECVYGEILPSSINKIFDHLNLRGKNFLDIGSGLGKIVIQIALEYPINTSSGIEISKKRYIISEIIKKKINTDIQNKISFINKDINRYDQINYDLIFFSNLCFSNKQNLKISNILLKNKCILICLKEIETLNEYLKYYITNIESSWSNNINVYYYFINL